MSTFFDIDEKLAKHVLAADTLADQFIRTINENYNSEANLGISFDEKIASYTIVESQFENLFLSLRYRKDYFTDIDGTQDYRYIYEIMIECLNLDNQVEIKIYLSDDSVQELPNDLVERLENKLMGSL